jgi:hypothetical protein
VRHPAAEEFLQFVFADACWKLYQFPRNARTRLKSCTMIWFNSDGVKT